MNKPRMREEKEKQKQNKNCTEEKSRFKRYLMTPERPQRLRFLALLDRLAATTNKSRLREETTPE
jgi:hypothetical protein